MYFIVCSTHSLYLLFFPPPGCQRKFYWPHRVCGGYNTEVHSASVAVSRYSWCFWSKRSVLTKFILYTRFSSFKILSYATYLFTVFILQLTSIPFQNTSILIYTILLFTQCNQQIHLNANLLDISQLCHYWSHCNMKWHKTDEKRRQWLILSKFITSERVHFSS